MYLDLVLHIPYSNSSSWRNKWITAKLFLYTQVSCLVLWFNSRLQPPLSILKYMHMTALYVKVWPYLYMKGKSKLHIRPRCVGIMSSRVWPSLSLMLRCCHQSVINVTVLARPIMTLAPWQTTHSVKLDTISDLDKQMKCCIWIHFVMYNPRCYIPKCICAVVWYKSTLSTLAVM